MTRPPTEAAYSDFTTSLLDVLQTKHSKMRSSSPGSSSTTAVIIISMPHSGQFGRADKGVDAGIKGLPYTGGSTTELSATDACRMSLDPMMKPSYHYADEICCVTVVAVILTRK